MQEFREQAVQRLVEPTMVADCLRTAVTEFAEPTLSREDAERLARMVRERCDHADEVRLARSPRLWDWGGDHVPPASMDADVVETYADEYHEALATGDLTIGLRSVSDYPEALGLSDPGPLVRRMMARVILREMAASRERIAARYRAEVVPYLERAEPVDLVQEALDTLDRLDDPYEHEFDDREVIEQTSSAPRRTNDDVWEDDIPEDVATGSVADVMPCGVAVEGATFVGKVAADQVGALLERHDGLSSSETVIGLWDRFATDMSGPLGGWNADNARHSKGVARLWERVHPDLPLHAIEPRQATESQRIVISLPSMHAKARVWTERPIREVVDLFSQLPRDPDEDDEADGVSELVETLEAENGGRAIDRSIISLAAWNRQASWLRGCGHSGRGGKRTAFIRMATISSATCT